MKKILLFVAFFVAFLGATSLIGCNKAEPDPVEDPFAIEESNASVVVTTDEVASSSTDQLNAETVLASAMKSAADENKRVLVHLGAPW